MRNWKLTGVIATIVIILSVPLYLLRITYLDPHKDKVEQKPVAQFVGGKKCLDCHKKQYDAWLDSHHDHAMDVANEKTVLGDFDNAVFENRGMVSRFYRKGDRYFVNTRGPEGKMGEFEITHTFGWFPLQQYLVPFPGGRWQCLPIAWDVKEKKWYHLPPEVPLDPNDWLYWTNAAQNWNGMCAQCHSTNLKKNYDPQSDTYQTTWSDIDVGCEACHGPGSRHVDWAELPDMARPQVENLELIVKTSGLDSRSLVELCAPCHSRRAALGDYTHTQADLLDSMLPQVLTEDLYFPDGQILEEVYVYGSFTQSKMYHRDVRCSDCHDVHSIKTVKKGNELCLQCHRASEYDNKEHHLHKTTGEKGEPIKSAEGKVLFEVGTGAECIQCHMPGRIYMGIDYRLDHGFRVPRPDLSIQFGTPNACNRCHIDKPNKWSDEFISKWYGPGRKAHYASVIAKGQKKLAEARTPLIHLAGDPLYPVIVRATALSLLPAYPGNDTAESLKLALMDDEALIRRTAINSLSFTDDKTLTDVIGPLLYDPVKAVRTEAAQKIAGNPSRHLSSDQGKVFRNALHEFIKSMEYSADFAFGRYNLANLYTALDRPQEAIGHYLAAIHIDGLFYPAKVNLALLYNQQRKNDEAETLLREVVEANPELYDVAYSLGLLLVEMNKYAEAAVFLQQASEGLPERSRIQYNLGLLWQRLRQDSAAEAALIKALKLEPDNMDYLYALADFHIQREQWQKAEGIAEQMVARHPDHPMGHQLIESLRVHPQNK